MWRGSAMEYRHERDNEIVCEECGSKRKDLCRDTSGNVVDGHSPRSWYMALETRYERLQDEACEVGIQLANQREKIRKSVEVRAGLTGSATRGE